MRQTFWFITQLFLIIVLAHQVAYAQVVVTGTVTDAKTGEALPGVTVAIQGTLRGTTTDADGSYTLELDSADDVLIFRFVGYRAQMSSLDAGSTTLDIQMMVSVLGLDEVVVVGSRRLPRLVKDSAVPVDVLGPRDLEASSSTDIDEVLRTLVPSYNVQRHGIDDEATLVRPITLRGLPADNVLVLVNGKRRHRSASLALLGSSLNTGAQGPDLNMIPGIAIKQVEILRDGASAQYGADAVAGVFNMQLRDASDGVLVKMQGGQHVQGDGEYVHVAANVGLPLTSNGFLNLSLEYRNAAPTIRSAQRDDATILASRGYPVANPAQIWGAPDVDNSWVGFFNAGLDLGSSAHAYAFGGWGQRTAEGGFFFRAPGTVNARGSVFRFGSGANATRAVADLNDSDDVVCGDLPDLPSLDSDQSAVATFISSYSGKCFLFNEPFPGGFTPRFGADIGDLSVVAGVRGGGENSLQWDASLSIARSALDYFIYNTVNASYGPDSPTSFKPRAYLQEELTASLGMSLPISISVFASPLNVAWGAEWRKETFESKAGDFDSYNPGPYTSQGFSVGSNGYQGLNPKFADRWDRPNYSLYLDLEADVTKALVVGVAARFENFYQDFGSTLKGKVATLYRVSDRISLRGTVSSGFRAPSPGQANLQALQTALSSDGDFLVESGQLPSTHPIAAGLGGKPLTEETATSFSLGSVVDLSENLSLTFDYFNISIKDRISLTGNIAITDEVRAIMDARDLLGGVQNLAEVKFFSNDFDTRTIGTDLLLSYDREWDNGDATIASVAWNRTNQELVDFSAPQDVTEFLGEQLSEPFTVSVLSPRRQTEIEDLNPSHRVVLSGRHVRGPLHGLLRLNYYDGWYACRSSSNACATDAGQSLLDYYESQIIVDVEVGYAFRNSYRIALGINNLFDVAPAAHPEETGNQGNSHPESTPWDYSGGAWYLRFTADMF